MSSTEAAMAPEELTSLIASASHQYALKHYEAAADLYSRATSVQAELNGEMNIENADLLYAYGRCLYHVAITNSDVLGGKVAGPAGDAKKGEKRKRQGAAATAQGSSAAQGAQLDVLSKKHADVVEKVVETAVEGKSGMNVAEKEQQAKEESKPFFEITGDDDEWQDEDEDEDTEADEAAQGEEDEEEDDFATAYEILEMARILLSKKVETLSEENGQDAANTRKDADDSPFRKALSSLADTHDLQAEISLENERFTDAVSDARSSLQLKEKLYPPESSLVAEAHFKLSLALEFASATEPKNSTDAKAGGEGQSSTSEQQQQPDEEATKALREDSVSHMEAAIKSSEGRVDLERKKLADLKGEEAEKARRSIKDVEEIVKDMKQRLEDLKAPPESLSFSAGAVSAAGPSGAPLGDGQDAALQGLLGSILGESPVARKQRIEEATSGATDLTGLVKHKGKSEKVSGGTLQATSSVEKRKSEDPQESENKKAKTS